MFKSCFVAALVERWFVVAVRVSSLPLMFVTRWRSVAFVVASWSAFGSGSCEGGRGGGSVSAGSCVGVGGAVPRW